MPIFAFQAKQMDGRGVKGEIEASSEVEARVKIRAQQMIPIKVVASNGAGGGTSLGNMFSGKGGVSGLLIPKVKTKDLKVFTRQFATLINSGVAVVQSLELLERSSSNPTLKLCLTKIRQDISMGKKLADSMAIHDKIFDRLYVNLVRAGEEAGVLDTILNRLAVYIEKSVKIKNKVLGAMYYPAGILVVAGLVLFAILHFVIPKFEELFKASNQELPLPTQMVIEMSHFVQSHGWMLIVGLAFVIFFIKQYYDTEGGRYNIDRFLLNVPVVGTLLQKSAVARFSSTLSTLLTCGVGILDALEISSRVCGNAVIEKTLISAKKVISEGKSIVQPLSQDKYIPDMVTQMIAVGEQTGAMDVMLGKVADFYEEEVDAAVAALTSLIEPIMMIFLGGLIGGIVVAMYLPIFNLASAVQ